MPCCRQTSSESDCEQSACPAMPATLATSEAGESMMEIVSPSVAAHNDILATLHFHNAIFVSTLSGLCGEKFAFLQ